MSGASGASGASDRRKSKKPGLSPMHQKIDIGLKKQLLAAEAERTAKAKRDAEDERLREMEEFRKTNSASASNLIMP